MNDCSWANHVFQFVLSVQYRFAFQCFDMGTNDGFDQSTQYSAHVPVRHSLKYMNTDTGSLMKIQLIVSRSILCVLSLMTASCALVSNERADGHAGVGLNQNDRLSPIAMNSTAQHPLKREASAGPTILCDEHGPRALSISEREHRMTHTEAFGFTEDSRSALRMSSAEPGYLKLTRED